MEVAEDASSRQAGDDHNEMEEGEEEEDEAAYCPVFGNSALVHFMTDKAYEQEEERHNSVASEHDFKLVRPMRGKVGLLENPHGSVRLWQGDTGVLAAVYGPSDVRMSKELPHRAAVDILFRPKVTGSGNLQTMLAAGMMDPMLEERAIEQTVASVLESVIFLEDHVQAGFNVILHEVQNDGGLLSTCLNAACLALLNAGCSLRSMFAAVSLGVCGDKLVVDPNAKQIEQMQLSSQETGSPCSIVTLVVTNMTGSPQVLHASALGRVTPKTLATCIKFVVGNETLLEELFGFFGGMLRRDLGLMASIASSSKHGNLVKEEKHAPMDQQDLSGDEVQILEEEEEDGEIAEEQSEDDE